MKEGWEYIALSSVCKVQNGFAFNSKLFNESNNGLPLIRIRDIKRGYSLTYTSEICSDEFFVEDGDMLIGMDGDFNIGEWKGGHALLNQRVCKLIPSEKILAKFIFYFIPEALQRINDKTAFSTVKHLSSKQVNAILLPNLPLSEQQSIVDYLDSTFAKIDAIKANAEKALDEAKALFQASLKEMLEPKEGVKLSTIGDLFDTYSGGTPTKSNKEYYEGGSIPWLRSGEVCQKDIVQTEMFITEKGLKESSAKYYPENTVVVAMYGATAAQVGILRIKATSNQAVCGILPHKDFLPEFVYYWFSSIEDKLAAQAQGGAQPNISQQKIKKVEISIYSITEQQSIVANLDSLKSKVDRLQENYDKISQECDALKQAILRQIFE